MEEERYITVLHNRLRREEFEKVKRLRNSNIIHSILWFVNPLIDKLQWTTSWYQWYAWTRWPSSSESTWSTGQTTTTKRYRYVGFQWHPLLPALYLFYTVAGSLPLKRRHSYLKWKKERLQRAVNLSKKDLQLSKIYTVGPHFKHCWSWSYVLLSDIVQLYIFSNIVFSNFIAHKCFTLAGPWCIWVIMKVATYITYVHVLWYICHHILA